MESLNKEDYEAKEKVFYSAMISAWLNTRLERDKQLLGLSVTAIGLLVTLLRTVGVSNFVELVLFSFALLAFLVTVIAVIYILQENAGHIERMLDKSENESKILTFLDKFASISFVIGMLLIVLIGVNSAFINLSKQGETMSQEKQSDTHRQTVNNDSWNGIANLKPQPPKETPPIPSTTPTSSSSATSGGSASSGNTGTASSGK